MALTANIDISTFQGKTNIEINAAASMVLVDANGSGKTRLGVFLDQSLSIPALKCIVSLRILPLSSSVPICL